MPLSKHFKGKGAEVMRSMRKKYGDKAERVFYATENKMKKKMMMSEKEMGSMMKKGKMGKRGKNPFFGNSLPFQLADGDRWFKDSRPHGKMSFKKKGK